MPMIRTGCENCEAPPPFPVEKLLYGTTLTGTDVRDWKGFDPTSGWTVGPGITGQLVGIKPMPMLATAGSAGEVVAAGFMKDGENTFAPGLSLNS